MFSDVCIDLHSYQPCISIAIFLHTFDNIWYCQLFKSCKSNEWDGVKSLPRIASPEDLQRLRTIPPLSSLECPQLTGMGWEARVWPMVCEEDTSCSESDDCFCTHILLVDRTLWPWQILTLIFLSVGFFLFTGWLHAGATLSWWACETENNSSQRPLVENILLPKSLEYLCHTVTQ